MRVSGPYRSAGIAFAFVCFTVRGSRNLRRARGRLLVVHGSMSSDVAVQLADFRRRVQWQSCKPNATMKRWIAKDDPSCEFLRPLFGEKWEFNID